MESPAGQRAKMMVFRDRVFWAAVPGRAVAGLSALIEISNLARS
jgi:hypothetical protein